MDFHASSTSADLSLLLFRFSSGPTSKIAGWTKVTGCSCVVLYDTDGEHFGSGGPLHAQTVSYFVQSVMVFLSARDYRAVRFRAELDRWPWHRFSNACACDHGQVFQVWSSGLEMELGPLIGWSSDSSSVLCPFHIRPISSVMLPTTILGVPLLLLLLLLMLNWVYWTWKNCRKWCRDMKEDELKRVPPRRRWWQTPHGFNWRPYARTATCKCRMGHDHRQARKLTSCLRAFQMLPSSQVRSTRVHARTRMRRNLLLC
jgi:hypothetical protein